MEQEKLIFVCKSKQFNSNIQSSAPTYKPLNLNLTCFSNQGDEQLKFVLSVTDFQQTHTYISGIDVVKR